MANIEKFPDRGVAPYVRRADLARLHAQRDVTKRATEAAEDVAAHKVITRARNIEQAAEAMLNSMAALNTLGANLSNGDADFEHNRRIIEDVYAGGMRYLLASLVERPL